MARVTAVALRDRARSAMLAAGGRGFVRFPERGALLVSDAIRRCEDDAAKARLISALEEAGFACREQEGMLLLTPSDALLECIDCSGGSAVDWDGPLCGAQALAARWLGCTQQPLTQRGRMLVIEALRLTWQGRAPLALDALRAQAAVMQREKDTSGFRQAGAVLKNWCDMQEGISRED